MSRELRWRFLRPKDSLFSSYSAHLLVVKKPIYINLAKICIKSFLYWNQSSSVTVHCDETTYEIFSKWRTPRHLAQRISILNSYAGDSRTWQDIKLDLLMSLNGKNDFFMDADLRWNGTLDIKGSNPTFFVREFKLSRKSPYKQLLAHEYFVNYRDPYMWNTSFFTFSNFSLSHQQIKEVFEIHKKILVLVESDLFGEDDRPSLIRIAEQLALSIAAANWATNIIELKNSDGFKDGSFVESSYFGATGASF